MLNNSVSDWPAGVNLDEFQKYEPRSMGVLGHWIKDDWAIKAYGIQAKPVAPDAPLIAENVVDAAREHVESILPLTQEEGSFYKTGFAVLHEGVLANWLLFQWWTHTDVWCQLLSYSKSEDPTSFMYSTRPIRACVYETAIIWHEQKSWMQHVLNGSPDRRAYLEDMMQDQTC